MYQIVTTYQSELHSNFIYHTPQHAVKVARGLERRWHHIWLRSLEWQCLLEQWIHRLLNTL